MAIVERFVAGPMATETKTEKRVRQLLLPGVRCLGLQVAGLWLGMSATASAEDVRNLTGLPAYPNLSSAAMDENWKTDTLGRWCARFAASTGDPLEVVESWYRKRLTGASETDLNNDPRYATAQKLTGIKLAMGVDSVTIFKVANQASTSIELFRCSAPNQETAR
jgi:hypothetical protein